MATSTLAQRYKINGVVNTDNPVMDNLDQLSQSSGCFVTYDAQQGKWGVIINTSASSVKTFDDSNIIGPVNVTTTNLFDLYNQIEIEFPLLDTADKTDYVRINTSNAVRSINEPDNQIKISLNFCSDPVQAYVLGNVQLNQTRLDKVVTFETDYSALSLNAGDVISLTNSLYQFNEKDFRIITLKEIDGDDGSLRCEVTALEYDSDIYDLTNIPRSVKTDLTGIQTIGAMTAPSVSFQKFESSARPQINVVSTVPAGIIEGVECWVSTNGTNYELRQTIKQEEQTLTAGGTVTFEFDDIPAGNVYAKTRGTNYSVSGPFSNVATTTYSPVQITDAVDANTAILENGLPLSLLLSLPNLLKGLDKFLNGSTNPTSLDDLPGDLVSTGFMVSADSGRIEEAIIPASSTDDGIHTIFASTTFVAPYTGNYKIDVIVDQNTSGADGGRGTPFSEPKDIIRVGYDLNDITAGSGSPVYVTGESSGGVGAFYWTDYAIAGLVNLTAGNTYYLTFDAYAYTESHISTDCNMTVGWNVFTVVS